jgi:hypothetical protein
MNKKYQVVLMQGHLLCSTLENRLSLPLDNSSFNIIKLNKNELKEYMKSAVIFSGTRPLHNKSWTIVYRYDLPHYHLDGILPKLPEDYVWIPVERFRDGSYDSKETQNQFLPSHLTKLKRMLNDIEALK